MNIEIKLTSDEYKIFQQLGQKQGLDEKQLFKQMLRVYQAVYSGLFKLTPTNELPKKWISE